tara:strand:- start:275 stop:406 length:132 start_codon:yes stop_codon:yes gene_type:complete
MKLKKYPECSKINPKNSLNNSKPFKIVDTLVLRGLEMGISLNL